MKTEYITDDLRIKKLLSEIQTNNSWVAFDCEFKKNSEYDKELSIITLCTETDVYILDFLQCDFLQEFIELLENKSIQKITHAGHSDYDIFYRLKEILPQNTIDTQILASFAARNLPMSLGGLIELKFGESLKKENAATDWIKRPLSEAQLEYAAQDVTYLKRLMDLLQDEVKRKNRFEWALNECNSLGNKSKYSNHELKQILARREISELSQASFIFIIRLIKWQAKEKKVYECEIFKQRLISDLLRILPGGKQALLNDTRIKKSVLIRYIDEIFEMYTREPTSEEITMFEQIIPDTIARDKRNNALDMLYAAIDNLCINEELSTKAVITRDELKQMKNLRQYVDYYFSTQHVIDFLGKEFIELLRNIDEVIIQQDYSGIKIEYIKGS